MKSTDNRTLFGTPIGASAAAGNIAAIPQTQVSAGDGTASVALGFPPETFIARAAGGEPPRGQDMNGLLNLLSSALQVLQAGYLGPFDAGFAQSIGGYPLGAVVAGTLPGTFWVSTAEANVSTPGAQGATWQSLFNGYATQAWSNTQFLQMALATLQSVTGPVAFGGQTTVPDVALFNGKDALNAETAEGRYVRSIAVSGQARIADLVQDANGRTVSNTTVLANLADIPVNFVSAPQVIQNSYIYSVPHNLGRTPTAFGAQLQCVIAELGYQVGEIMGNPCTTDNTYVFAFPISEVDGNLTWKRGNSPISIINKSNITNMQLTNITLANWRILFWAI
ncbi:MAG: hypothetical protein ABF636_11280 [Acetobacter sp.]